MSETSVGFKLKLVTNCEVNLPHLEGGEGGMMRGGGKGDDEGER